MIDTTRRGFLAFLGGAAVTPLVVKADAIKVILQEPRYIILTVPMTLEEWMSGRPIQHYKAAWRNDPISIGRDHFRLCDGFVGKYEGIVIRPCAS